MSDYIFNLLNTDKPSIKNWIEYGKTTVSVTQGTYTLELSANYFPQTAIKIGLYYVNDCDNTAFHSQYFNSSESLVKAFAEMVCDYKVIDYFQLFEMFLCCLKLLRLELIDHNKKRNDTMEIITAFVDNLG